MANGAVTHTKNAYDAASYSRGSASLAAKPNIEFHGPAAQALKAKIKREQRDSYLERFPKSPTLRNPKRTAKRAAKWWLKPAN